MAHEFMFSPYMQKGPIGRLLGAFGLMCLGAGTYLCPVVLEHDANMNRLDGTARLLGLI
jgi:hypothetical protein